MRAGKDSTPAAPMSSKKERNELLRKCQEALAAEDFEACRAAAAVIVEGDEGNYQGWVVSGRAALGLKEHAEGERAFKRALALDGTKLPALAGLADLYAETGDDAASAKILDCSGNWSATRTRKSFGSVP